MNSLVANEHSSRTTWAGTWGLLADGRSKLSRRRKEIERDLVLEYRPDTPLAQRRVHRAAELMALSDMTMDLLGHDPKATRRAATSLTLAAERTLAAVRINRRSNGDDSPASLLADMAGQNGDSR